MQPVQALYRFSPIKTEAVLKDAIEYVVDSSEALLKEFLPGIEPLLSVTIFAHYQEEYDYLKKFISAWGKPIENGYIKLDQPINYNERVITKLRIRQPDPYRSQVGCVDYDADFNNTLSLVKKYPNQVRLIDRPNVKLIELHHPDYDVLAYIVKAETELPVAGTIKEVKIYADGGSRGNPGPSASGYVVMDMDNHVLFEAGVYLGITTNNQAEYQALKFGLEQAKKMGAREVHAHMDSLLVVNQMKGIFKVRNRDLWPIHEAIKSLCKDFAKVSFTHVPRELNKLADAEVNKCLDAQVL